MPIDFPYIRLPICFK